MKNRNRTLRVSLLLMTLITIGCEPQKRLKSNEDESNELIKVKEHQHLGKWLLVKGVDSVTIEDYRGYEVDVTPPTKIEIIDAGGDFIEIDHPYMITGFEKGQNENNWEGAHFELDFLEKVAIMSWRKGKIGKYKLFAVYRKVGK